MEQPTFLADLESMLELAPGSLSLTQELPTHAAWDSLAIVSFLAMADSKYGKRIPAGRLAECKTVQDLFDLVQAA